MVFTVKNAPDMTNYEFSANFHCYAIERALSVKLDTTDKLMDIEVERRYGICLREAVLRLIYYAKTQRIAGGEYRITFMTRELDNIANFITNGDLTTRGSNILRVVFDV